MYYISDLDVYYDKLLTYTTRISIPNIRSSVYTRHAKIVSESVACYIFYLTEVVNIVTRKYSL